MDTYTTHAAMILIPPIIVTHMHACTHTHTIMKMPLYTIYQVATFLRPVTLDMY